VGVGLAVGSSSFSLPLSNALLLLGAHLPRCDHANPALTTSFEDHKQIPTGEAPPVCQKPATTPSEHPRLTVEDLFDLMGLDLVSRNVSDVDMIPLEAGNAHWVHYTLRDAELSKTIRPQGQKRAIFRALCAILCLP